MNHFNLLCEAGMFGLVLTGISTILVGTALIIGLLTMMDWTIRFARRNLWKD